MKNPHAVALGRLGGKASKGKTSERKTQASRANGKKGGRPKKKITSERSRCIAGLDTGVVP